MIEKKFIGFVLKKVDYQDNDAIFNVLTLEEKITFKAKGILKITSKNASSCNFFMLSEFITNSKSEVSNKSLKSCSIVKLYKKPYEDLLVSSSYLFICNMLDLVSEQINGYEMALKCFDYLEDNQSPLNVLNFFLKHLIISLGYESNLKGCVICNKKTNLISFDLESGGFVCSDCFNINIHEKMPSAFLKDLYSFLKEEDLFILDENKALKTFKMYVRFLNEVVGINTSSSDFVLRCL